MRLTKTHGMKWLGIKWLVPILILTSVLVLFSTARPAKSDTTFLSFDPAIAWGISRYGSSIAFNDDLLCTSLAYDAWNNSFWWWNTASVGSGDSLAGFGAGIEDGNATVYYLNHTNVARVDVTSADVGLVPALRFYYSTMPLTVTVQGTSVSSGYYYTNYTTFTSASSPKVYRNVSSSSLEVWPSYSALAVPVYFSWYTGSSPPPTVMPVFSFDALWQYIIAGDFLGLVIGIYQLQMGGYFLGFVMLLLAVPLYIRTQSLTYVFIMWLLLMPLCLAFLPIAAEKIVGMMLVLALGGLLFEALGKFSTYTRS